MGCLTWLSRRGFEVPCYSESVDDALSFVWLSSQEGSAVFGQFTEVVALQQLEVCKYCFVIVTGKTLCRPIEVQISSENEKPFLQLKPVI